MNDNVDDKRTDLSIKNDTTVCVYPQVLVDETAILLRQEAVRETQQSV